MRMSYTLLSELVRGDCEDALDVKYDYFAVLAYTDDINTSIMYDAKHDHMYLELSKD